MIKGLKNAIDPIMDFTGIWQEPWGLYAPDVVRVNVWVEARVYIEGQSDFIEWRSPHWRSLNCFERFTKSREIEYYDRIRFNSSAPAHPSFARYLLRDFQSMRPDDTVSKIELISSTEETPPPEKAGTKPKIKRILFYTLNLEK